MNILIIGSGGREHALAWKLKQSPQVEKLFIAPGNPGTATIGTNLPLDILDHQAVINATVQHQIDLVVVGPDDALASGIVNSLEQAGIKVFGPTKEAAEIEWSKAFAKDLLNRLGIPAASSKTFRDAEEAKLHLTKQTYPVVIKASGLALGKGVLIAHNYAEATQAIDDMLVNKKYGLAGATVLIEEYLVGEEFSVHAFCDGETAVLFPAAQDHKRIYDNDEGPNTGGMGTIAPVPHISQELLEEIKQKMVMPVLQELKRMGRPFKGVLFPGIMLTKEGPKVLEFNARFGDPETQSFMRILKTDLVEIFLDCIDGNLRTRQIEWDNTSACCVVMTSGGYPAGTYQKDLLIIGIEDAEEAAGVIVFHAGTATKNEQLVTAGGRVLGVTAIGSTPGDAVIAAYQALVHISFDGAFYRSDIGKKALRRT